MQVVDPFNLDWGNITPDGYNEQKNEVIFIFNFDISSQESVERGVVFAVGKLIWTMKNIPPCNYRLVLDLRGQALTLLDRARKMKEDIINAVIKDKSFFLGIEILI